MDITLLTPNDLIWPLGVNDSSPYYRCGAGSYPRNFPVDPFPCYSHDLALVHNLVDRCEEAFPLTGTRSGLWLLSHEAVNRMNGATFEDSLWYREDGKEWEDLIRCYCGCGEMKKMSGQAASIVLSGKRIPIMPSMTRYLVTHEYGHAVFNYTARKLGYKEDEKSKLEEKYMSLKGIDNYSKVYGGGKWHISPGEIIANDFRILFTKQEMEFYPHECQLPSRSSEGKWWEEVKEICGG